MSFFAHLQQKTQLFRQVSELAFAQARVKLFMISIPSLNNWQAERAIPDVGYLLYWRNAALSFACSWNSLARIALPVCVNSCVPAPLIADARLCFLDRMLAG